MYTKCEREQRDAAPILPSSTNILFRGLLAVRRDETAFDTRDEGGVPGQEIQQLSP